jgi:oxygen-dependent protoporphyrinogen oxidase
LTSSSRNRVVVVGGGISGLATAWRLLRERPDLRVEVIEGLGRFGGKLLTVRKQGFVIEGAADGFLARKPPALDWAHELGLERALVEPRPEDRFSHVWWEGQLHRMPEGFSGLVPADPEGLKKTTLLTPGGAARAAAEAEVPPRTDGGEESLEAFFTRRYGSETFQRLMEPLLAGIYAGDASRLSAEAAFPQLTAIERSGRSLTTALAPAPGPRATPSPAFRSFDVGMDRFPSALELWLRRSAVPLWSGSPVLAVERTGTHWTVRTRRQRFEADAVVLALPPRSAGAVVRDSIPGLASVLETWPVSSVANLNLAFDASEIPQLPAGSGFVAPRAGGTPWSAATWSSRKWPGRAPDGKVLVRIYFGGARAPEAWKTPGPELVAMGLELLAGFHHGRRPRPLFHQIFRWKDAFAQPDIGHADRHRALEAAGVPGLVLAGGYFAGVGIPDCLARAGQAAELVLKSLKESPKENL